LDRAVDAIVAARDRVGCKILVHCSAAVSRSPTVVTAYLMKECGMTLKEALGAVVRKRAAVNPNQGLFKQLKAL
ncbi:protein-tyrosine phosphatase-like protein, partial [Cristinia sonorae]